MSDETGGTVRLVEDASDRRRLPRLRHRRRAEARHPLCGRDPLDDPGADRRAFRPRRVGRFPAYRQCRRRRRTRRRGQFAKSANCFGDTPGHPLQLDMIISVGYRVSSAKATVFRRWATAILVQFAKKGFVVDTPRLKQHENVDPVAELREIIRDLRLGRSISTANCAPSALSARTMTARRRPRRSSSSGPRRNSSMPSRRERLPRSSRIAPTATPRPWA